MPDYYVRNEFPVTTIIEDEEGKALDDDAIDAAIDKAIVDHDMNKLVDYVLEGGVDKLKDKVPTGFFGLLVFPQRSPTPSW